MLRRLAVLVAAAAALAALAAPASAAVNWAAKYKTFAQTRCESPGTIADIDRSASTMRSEKNGAPMLSNQTGFTVERASTVEADASKLVCEITVSVLNRGRTLTQHGKYTITLFGKKWRSSWEPGY